MELIIISKALSDYSFLFFFCSYALLLFGRSPFLFPAFAVMCTVTFLSYMIDVRKGGNMRFLPLALMAPIFIMYVDLYAYFATAISFIFGFIVIKKQFYINDYGEALDNFQRNIKITLGLLVLSLATGIFTELGSSVLPFVVIYFISTVTELSMLRHSRETLSEKRFKMLNSAMIFASCALGFFMSTKLFMNFVLFLGGIVRDFIIAPIIMLASVITSGVVYAVMMFFTKVVFKDANFKPGEVVFPELMSGLVDDYEAAGFNPTVEIAGKLILGVLIVIAVIVIIKKLVGRKPSKTVTHGSESRTVEYVPLKKPKENLPAEVKNIRTLYKKFLTLLQNRGMKIPVSFTSLHLNKNINSEVSDKASVEKLREYYILARYSPHEMTKEDYIEAKKLYGAIKKDK